MVELLAEASMEAGIAIHNSVTITSIGQTGPSFTVQTEDGRRFDSDLVVHGAGSEPEIADLALDRTDVQRSRRGIAVDEKMETTHPDIFAVGDCAATVQLARVADAEAQTAAANIASRYNDNGHETFMDYTAVPAVLFTYPQYGMVGATEDTLKDDGIDYEKSFGKELGWPTYRRIGMKSAAFKVLVGQTDGCILGAHILSDNATGLINTFTLAMHNRIPVKELHRQSVMTPYPSRESDVIYMLNPLL
jgi:glutathione reductase (NADPH)